MILLLRHGETFWNRERRIQGHAESDLTPLGERQAQAMARLAAELVAREPGDDWRLVSSPIGRARRTAEAVAAATGLTIELDPRLAEICCGQWEGRLRAELTDVDPAQPMGEWIFSAPGGETFEDVMARARGWLEDLPAEPGRRVVAVSHGVWGRLLRGAYGGLDRAATVSQDVPQDAVFRLQNGQIDRFDCEPLD